MEQQLFGCKQGFLSLGSGRAFDDRSLEKICRTLTAMANGGVGSVGYVAVGIADDAADAEKIEVLDGVTATLYRGFQIVGIDRETTVQGSSLNDYFAWIIQRIRGLLPEPFDGQVASETRFVGYNDRAVLLLKASAGPAPIFVNDQLYERSGSDTLLVPIAEYMRIFARFHAIGCRRNGRGRGRGWPVSPVTPV